MEEIWNQEAFCKKVWIQGPNSIEKGEIEEIKSLNVN
jgi:hypothetical protein